ncbi:carboxylesterase/lipase family protein [Hymenobacter convexus]|uniref:carboxylesterase/lipase family protein n=1 Tax=Hymenobacter sp. CA1UV-4 TaxID=3063782 RepID=UPI002712630A|nr:carboxylesterase family protein [Hymenobacter sp. CA1UV-4]MDO7849984.1 carboxylesterase family protein [Hymenobacter sp. CA1UV-4]
MMAPFFFRWFLLSALAGGVPLLAGGQGPGPGPVASTVAGRLQGTREASGGLAFRGVAYAEAPTGAARFRPPQPLRSWSGVRPATAFGPHAPQNTNNAPAGDENCLTLNVWTPSLRAARPKPVVVWVHGGSFTGGSGDDFPGQNFAGADSLVAVSINYRLGSFGFLQLGNLLGPEYRQAGNLGLLDAVAALRWVHANIAAFGGDPGRVTVMGESAGAKLLGAVLATPAADGLYQQVILESGGTQAVRDTATAATVTARLLTALGLRPDQARQFLTLPTADILRAQQQLTAGPNGLQLFGPVRDGRTIPEEPLAHLARKRPLLRALVGTNRDEAGLFMGFWPTLRQPNADVLTNLFGTNGAPVWRAYQQAARTQPTDQAWLRTTTDYLYRLASYRLAGTLARAGHAVWLYRFDYRVPGGAGPVHAQELGFVWNTLGPKAAAAPSAQELARQMHRRWVSFIATGSPGAEWPAYVPTRPQALVFDSVSRAQQFKPYEDAAFPNQAFHL